MKPFKPNVGLYKEKNVVPDVNLFRINALSGIFAAFIKTGKDFYKNNFILFAVMFLLTAGIVLAAVLKTKTAEAADRPVIVLETNKGNIGSPALSRCRAQNRRELYRAR